MAEHGHGTSGDWALTERRSLPLAWIILGAGTMLCVIATLLA